MIGLLVVGALAACALGIGMVLATVGLMLRGILWLVVLPFKLLFGALSLALILPFLLIGMIVMVIGVFAAIITPLLPLVLLLLLIYGVVRLANHHSRVSGASR